MRLCAYSFVPATFFQRACQRLSWKIWRTGDIEVRRVRARESENAELKRHLHDAMLDQPVLKSSGKQVLMPAVKREPVANLQTRRDERRRSSVSSMPSARACVAVWPG